MQALDFSAIANAPLNAMQAAAYGDALQENRYRNRLLHMADAEDARKKSVANLIAAGNWDASQQPAQPQAPVNQLAPQAPGPGMPALQQAPGAGIYGQMAQVPGDQQPAATNQLAGGGQPDTPGQAATLPDQFTQQRMKLRDLYNSGQINAADAQQYFEQIGVKETAAKWDNLKMQVEQGKLEQGKVDLLMDKLAPLVRASTPAQEEYERVFKATGDQQKAKAAAQPLYQDAIKTIVAMPGMGDAAKNAPKEFNPGLAYALKDTYAAIERRATAGDAQRAKADAAAEKANDRTITQVVTPAGLPVFADKNGGLFVNGKSYNGPVVKEKAGQGTSITVKMPDGTGGTDSFKEYTPEMKEQAFKDRNLGTYKYPTGMKSMAEKQAFDRQYYKWRVDGKISATDVTTERATVASNKAALQDLTKREALIGTFTNRIEATSKVVVTAFNKLGNTDSRLRNIPINKLKQYMGSGELRALNLAVTSLSNEVAKVESGSLGIAEVSEGQAQTMRKIHDFDTLSLNDVMKVIDMGKELGKTSMGSIKLQREDLTKEMRGKGNDQQPPASGKIGIASRRIASDLRGKWDDAPRQEQVYKNLKSQGYTDAEIGQAFAQAKGGQ